MVQVLVDRPRDSNSEWEQGRPTCLFRRIDIGLSPHSCVTMMSTTVWRFALPPPALEVEVEGREVVKEDEPKDDQRPSA